jgi:hypothetical protein
MLELLAMVCLVVAWLVPNHYPPWTSFYNESCAALGLTLLVISLGRRHFAEAAPWPVWSLLAVAAIPWLQWALGLLAFGGDALVGSLYVVGFAAAVVAGHTWAARDAVRAAVVLFTTVLAGAVPSALLGLAQALNVGEFGLWAEDARSGMRAVANLGQPNNLATLISLGLVGILSLRERGRLTPLLAIAIAALLVLGAAVTQSRTALLFGPAIWFGFWLASRRGVPLVTSHWAIASAAALHWILTFVWPLLPAALLSVAPDTAVARASGSVRTQMWTLLLDAAAHSPWHGYGWLQVGAAHLGVAELHRPGNEFWMNSHNLFLDLVLWCGVPLGLLLGGVVLYWYVNRALRVRSVESVTAFLAVTVFAIHAMLEFPHHYAYFVIPVGLWVGQIEWAMAQPGRVGPRWNLVPAGLGLLMLLAIWRDYPTVEDDFRLVRFENLRIGSVRAAEPAPHAPFLSGLTAFLRFSRLEPAAGMSAQELDFVEAVAKRYPYAASLYRMARALALNGRADEAAVVVDKLRHMHGEAYYRRLRADLRERVAGGQTGLADFERSLPEPAVR